MLIRYQDLVTLDLVATDGTTHKIQDIFMDDKALRATYAVVDTGGWFSGRQALVSVDRFGEPDVSASRWPCQLDEEALAERPEPERQAAEGQRVLPDALLIPVGAPVSPRLIHRSLGDEHLPIAQQADPKGRVPEGAHLRSAGEWIVDTDVLATDGKAGKLMGFIFESSDWTARYIIIETGGSGLPENQRVIEASRISSSDFDNRTLSIDVSIEEVQKALDLHEVDGIEGKWYNKVLAYYGLQS